MNDSPDRLFGLTIAYVLPGSVALWGISSLSPMVANWLSVQPQSNPTLASFLHALLASLTTGLTISALRWLLIDTLHHHTGVPFPNPDFSKVQEKLEAFQLAIEMYYRYYQFHANLVIAIAVAGFCRWVAGVGVSSAGIIVLLPLEALLLAASRDSLARYYARIAQLLGTRHSEEPGKQTSG